MDDDRKKRRQLRFDLSSRINKLEIAYCEPYPKSSRALKEDRENCKDCQVYKQLGMLGEELLGLSVRDEKVKIIEIPEPPKAKRIRKRKKSMAVNEIEFKPYKETSKRYNKEKS